MDSVSRAAALPVGAARRMRSGWPAVSAGSCRQRQQAHHGGGLAGAGAAGDQAEAAPGGQGAGEFLPVDLALVVDHRWLGEQPSQRLGQVDRHGLGIVEAHADGRGHGALVVPVAAQVEALAVQHQRRLDAVIAAARHQRATGQCRTPVGQFDAGEQFRRQACATAFVALGWQRQGKIRAGQGGGQVQADMAMAQLMADQRRGEQQQRRALAIQFEAEAGQGTVQRTQPAMFDPGVEQRQETLRVLQLGHRRGRRPRAAAIRRNPGWRG